MSNGQRGVFINNNNNNNNNNKMEIIYAFDLKMTCIFSLPQTVVFHNSNGVPFWAKFFKIFLSEYIVGW